MLKALLPKMVPTARSIAPMRTAAIDAAISGNEVVSPTSAVPTMPPRSSDCRDSPSCIC